MSSTLDQIRKIQEEANAKIEAIKGKAVTELALELNAARTRVKELEAQYEQLTGKPVRERSPEIEVKGKRSRMSQEEKKAAIAKLETALRASREGSKMKQLCEAVDLEATQVRNLLKEVKHKTTGNKASTVYFAK
jgi:hypothetical protein